MSHQTTSQAFVPSTPRFPTPSAPTPVPTHTRTPTLTSSLSTAPTRPSITTPTDPASLPHAYQTLLHIPPLAPSPSAARPSSTVLVWFRSDLRLHDHPALTHATEEAGPGGRVLPVYIFDPRAFGKTPFGFEKTGRYRAKFLIESVTTLRTALRQRGSDLIVRLGHPEQILPALCRRTGATSLMCHKEVALEDKQLEHTLQQALERADIAYEPLWANTLYHIDDLPFSLADMPDVYTQFRESVQKRAAIREPLPVPELQKPPRLDAGRIPCLADLGLTEPSVDAHGMHKFTGGEQEALYRLNLYVNESRRVPDGRSAALHLGADFSCRISPWLALGCVSPRKIYADLASKAAKAGQTTTYFELIWRDFFRYITAKYNRAKVMRASSGESVTITPSSRTPALTM